MKRASLVAACAACLSLSPCVTGNADPAAVLRTLGAMLRKQVDDLLTQR